ncbi:UNVERIFIED_CONTAM: hypothetical protein NCL1_46528 [Trichonephila clavipes]
MTSGGIGVHEGFRSASSITRLTGKILPEPKKFHTSLMSGLPDDSWSSIRYKSIILIKIHLGQIILQSAQYAHPYNIKLTHMEKKQQKNIIYNFPKRKRDGIETYQIKDS